MEIIRSIKKMQTASRLLAQKKTIGLVPTMGFLHEGHLSLIKKAKKHSDKVVVTIFVNPTQFGPNEDLSKYPRDEKGDINKIKQAGGDIVFIPKRDSIYPDGYETYVNCEKITQVLEGKSRPTHFRGVTTVVAKLFNIIRPDVAVFGQKDYQQAAVLKKMVSDLDYPIKMIIGSTVREKDGLAMSSRNKYFDANQRKEAVCLCQALKTAKQLIRNDKITDSTKLRAVMKKVIKKICPTAQIDYIAFTDFETLKVVKNINKNTICSLAVKLHGVRLIDNMKM
ncbi:MAG: pantoate--beta-alanine ligase [candidate division Zixibacteria bacterium]|nr:pantoate--beta-alanine ligase [candidate division Zixibacteria bacterium]